MAADSWRKAGVREHTENRGKGGGAESYLHMPGKFQRGKTAWLYRKTQCSKNIVDGLKEANHTLEREGSETMKLTDTKHREETRMSETESGRPVPRERPQPGGDSREGAWEHVGEQRPKPLQIQLKLKPD